MSVYLRYAMRTLHWVSSPTPFQLEQGHHEAPHLSKWRSRGRVTEVMMMVGSADQMQRLVAIPDTMTANVAARNKVNRAHLRWNLFR
ncbi:hypothetical protein Mapa_006166 [Marchantia paleacea]|nr:hypothetical protein Mapa_006166 [Marchantia paleacea]